MTKLRKRSDPKFDNDEYLGQMEAQLLKAMNIPQEDQSLDKVVETNKSRREQVMELMKKPSGKGK